MPATGRDRIRGQAWTKLQRALKQIAKLRQGDFVYPDSYEALGQIEQQLDAQVQMVARLQPHHSERLVASTYNNVLGLLYAVVPMMGFILRSTNVRNAFEAYDPLQRLCQKLLNREVRLILSSDWQFSPVTLPIKNYEQFPDLIFIGLPATEGDNVLLMPLAGHELAHSVWEEYQVGKPIREKALRYIREFLKSEMGFDKAKVSVLAGRAQKIALNQCEEVFCDVLSVRLFGSAAVAAFAYFFVPGSFARRPVYPPLPDRFAYIRRAFRSYFGYDSSLQWSDVQPEGKALTEDSPDPSLRAADAAMAKLADEMIASVARIADMRGISRPSKANIAKIWCSYRSGCPAEGNFSLDEILEAAWLFHEENFSTTKGNSPFPDLDALDRLSDIVFKTMEVVEVNRRTTQYKSAITASRRKRTARRQSIREIYVRGKRTRAPHGAETK